jgi:Tol biopolymer transport system component
MSLAKRVRTARTLQLSALAITCVVAFITCVVALLALRTSAEDTSALSPTGTIAVNGGSSSRRIYLVSPGSGIIRKVIAPEGVYGFDLSPNGRQIAFSGQTGIWIMKRDDSRARRISRLGAGRIAWSPDVRRLLVGGDESISMMSINGSGVRRVAIHAEAADWWPGGHRVVFVRKPEQSSRNGTISVIGANGRDLQQIVRKGRWYGPRVSPDGKRIAFYKAGVRGIYLASPESGKSRLFIRNGSQPEWSPDGRFMAFTRDVRCGEEVCSSRIFIVPTSGGKAHPYGPVLADIGQLSWSG